MRSLKEEAYGWLSERGSKYESTGNKGRPVLQLSQGLRVITQSDAKKKLGFDEAFLWKNDEQPNSTYVEDRLQRRVYKLGLPRRLHRVVGCGNNEYSRLLTADLELQKVFLTYSFNVQTEINAGRIYVV